MDSTKIAIKTNGGTQFLRMEDILYCIAHGRYTRIVTISGKEYFLSRILKDIENCLPFDDFFRTHKSYLINLNHIKNYHNNHDTPITLVNDVKIQLAKRRKKAFQERINKLIKRI